jgi:dolichol kinase
LCGENNKNTRKIAEICRFFGALTRRFEQAKKILFRPELGMEFARGYAVKKVYFKKVPIFPPAAVRPVQAAAILPDIATEAVRKSLHFLIALAPAIARLSYPLAILALAAGVLAYSVMEGLRLSGVNVPLVSALTSMASRQRDAGRFALGPVTLGIGALLALLLFPFNAAVIGILALAFGDGFAGLFGKLGKIRPAFLFGKSIEGSFACFAATFLSAFFVSKNVSLSLAAALAATAVEALPLENYDNIALPLAVGAVVMLGMPV